MTDERPAGGVRRGLLSLISGALVAQLVTVAILPLLSRLYGPSAFGEYAMFASVTALIAIVGTARYEMAIVLPKSSREAAGIAYSGIRLLLLVSVMVSSLAILASLLLPDIDPQLQWLLLLAGPEVFLLGYTMHLMQWYTRSGKFSNISRNRVVQSGGIGFAQLALGFVGLTSGVGLSAGLLFGQLVAAVFLTVSDGTGAHIIRAGRSRRWNFVFRKYWRLPVLLMPHTLVDSFRLNGVNLVVGGLSIAALGQYSQAWRLVQVPAGLVGSAISQVYFPRLASVPRNELFRTVRSSVIKSFALGAVPFLLLFLFSPSLFPLVLGAEWEQAGKFAQALVPALYVNLAASPISTVFIVLRKEQIGLLFSVTYTVLSLAALVVLGSDILLAVWAMSLCQAVALCVYVALALYLASRHP